MTRTDRRVERTRLLLHTALLSLMKEKEFDAISVQEITDRANVGRATFYSHYDNKEDLIESGFNGLLAELRERQREALGRSGDSQLFAFSRHLISHVDGHRDLFPAMLSKRGGALIQHLFRRVLVKVVRDDVKAMASRDGTARLPDDAIVEFIAGGLFGLLMWWLGGRKRLAVDEVDAMFRRLAIPAVKAAFH